jgi:hypothetical protein
VEKWEVSVIDDNRASFAALLTGVHDFYGKDASTFALSVWWEAMLPYDFDAVKDALNRHCVNPDTGQFMPKPADVAKMLSGSTVDSAMVAWSKVDRAIREVGTYRSIAFDDPLIHRVLTDMGGWVQIGAKSGDEWPFVRNEFVTRYRGYRMRSEIPVCVPVLIGICEATNNRAGFASDSPVLVGNPSRALEVMRCGSSAPLLQVTQVGDAASRLLLGKDAA